MVGGGFGGLLLARELAQAGARGRPVEVTLIDQRNHHTFQPLLYQVATAGLQPQDIGISLRATLRRHAPQIRLGEVVDIDPDAHTVTLADDSSVTYDRLVLAAGAVSTDLGLPGVADHSFGLKSLADATAVRNHVLRRFELASHDPDAHEDGSLTFVIAGGGPTGVELAGALAELVTLVLSRDHPDLDTSRVRIVLVEVMDRLLGGFSSRSAEQARRELERRGVEVRLGTGIAETSDTHVTFDDGEVLLARTLVWAAGVAASPLAQTLGVELGPGGRLPVDRRLRVEGVEDVHAIGDIALGLDDDGEPLPQVAPVAIQHGRYLSQLIQDELAREPTRPFTYRDKGTMATVGRSAAVAELPNGLRFGGFPAWIAWLVLHLWMLIGFKNRVGVLFSWFWNYLFRDHAARLIVDQREAGGRGAADDSSAATAPPEP